MKIDQQIEIMLREYSRLSTEAVERVRLGSQPLAILGAGVGVAIPLLRPDTATSLQLGLAVSGLIIVAGVFIINWKCYWECSEHIARIEQEIDGHSGGAKLLTWERRSRKVALLRSVFKSKNLSTALTYTPMLRDEGNSK